jgi:site-specific recombinase
MQELINKQSREIDLMRVTQVLTQSNAVQLDQAHRERVRGLEIMHQEMTGRLIDSIERTHDKRAQAEPTQIRQLKIDLLERLDLIKTLTDSINAQHLTNDWMMEKMAELVETAGNPETSRDELGERIRDLQRTVINKWNRIDEEGHEDDETGDDDEEEK